jgi:RNA polymerase-associated protein CTR9
MHSDHHALLCAAEIQKINGGERPAYQEIQFHCGLAQLKMMQSKREVATVEKQRLLSQAGDHLMDARKVDNSEQLVHLGLGMLYAAKGDLKLARDEFLRATKLKNNGKTNISGYLALAALSYSKNPKEALALYRQALKESPGCPSEVRLGIGACLLKIGDVEGAKAAFNRVITLDPSCPDAHLGLAVIKFANSNLQQGLADGMKLLLRAYELDPTHAGTLSLLAHYSLLRGDYDRSCSLSRAAVDACDIDFFKAESFCTLGRAQHAMGRIIDAQKAYINATRLDPLMALPHLGIAQHWLAVGSSNINAIGELERAIQLSPSFYEALRILGELSFDQSATKLEKILPSFREAAARREGDADIWELLGELLAQSDPSGSTKAYEHALSIHKKKREESLALRDEQRKAALALHEAKKKQKGKKEEGADLFGSDDEDDDPKVQNEEASKAAIEASLTPEHTIPPRLLNNAAVLLHRAGRTSEALRLMQDARDSLTQSTGLEFLTTLSYNIARLQEALGEIRQSTAEYKAILAKSPQYVDCYLRLSCIARRMGSLNEAIEWANKAMEIGESGDPNAIALLSQLHMDRRDYKSANDMIKMLQDARMQAEKRQAASGGEHKFDSYARIASGNLQLATAPIDRKKPEDAKKAEEKLMKAYMEYQHVLRGEPNNVFAANGIGAVLAELGRLDEAREIFQEVQAAVAASQGFVSIPDLYINLANVSLASQEYADSLNLYRVAMERLDASKQSQVLLYQARSAYDSGDYKIAKHFLLRAVHVAPLDYNLRFNAAVTMQQSAVRTYTNGPKRDAGDVSKLSDYRQAQEDLKQAKTYFEDLLSKGTEITKIDKARLSV